MFNLDESWRPSKSKLIVCFEPGGRSMFVQVDPDRPEAWRREPFYSKLKEWARDAVPGRGQVIIKIGKRAIVILPEKNVDVGLVEEDDLIVSQEVNGPTGVTLDAFKMKRDDPRTASLVPQSSRAAIPLR